MTDMPSELKHLRELKAAVDIGIADSVPDRFTEVASSEALSVHLAAVSATEEPALIQVLLNAPRCEPLYLARDQSDAGDI